MIGRSERSTVYNLQILRLIAASMVLFGHLEHEVWDRTWLSVGNFTPFEPVYWAGGVDIFFVISGFLMTYISYQHFGSVRSSLNFLRRRIIRIVPPYWFYTSLMILAALTAAAYVDHPAINYIHLLASYLFFPVMNPYGSIYPFFIIGWTLEYEMMFYVLFAVGLLFRRPLGLTLIYAAILALACSCALHPTWPPVEFWTNPIIVEFAFGMALGQLRMAGWRLRAWAGWLLSGVGVAAMVMLHTMGLTEAHWLLRWLWMGLPALLLCAGMALQNETKPPGRVKKWLVFGGDASYSLYLSHPFTINAVAAIAHRLGVASPQFYVLISFVAAFVVASGCYVWLERPIYALLSKVGEPASRAARPATSA